MQRALLTSGSYSQYDVTGLLEGPDAPPLRDLVKQFHVDYLTEHAHSGNERCRVGDVEQARRRLLEEGTPVNEEVGYYGWCSRVSGAAGLLAAWLIAQHGFQRVDYIEVWDGAI